MKQPKGFAAEGAEDLVCKLKKSIYGLKQSSRCWNSTLYKHLKEMGFEQSTSDPCIYMDTGGDVFCIVVYVDDMVLAGRSDQRIKQVSLTSKISENCTIFFWTRRREGLHLDWSANLHQWPSEEIWNGQLQTSCNSSWCQLEACESYWRRATCQSATMSVCYWKPHVFVCLYQTWYFFRCWQPS